MGGEGEGGLRWASAALEARGRAHLNLGRIVFAEGDAMGSGSMRGWLGQWVEEVFISFHHLKSEQLSSLEME
jgi:hypothetical protein